MNDPKLNLSPLDPATDAVRWERLVRSVAARGAEGAARRRPGGLVIQLAAWIRPAFAMAAAVALVTWAPTWLDRARRVSPTQPANDRAARLRSWASGEQPGTALFEVLGDDDDAR